MSEPTIYERDFWHPHDGLKAGKDWPAPVPAPGPQQWNSPKEGPETCTKCGRPASFKTKKHGWLCHFCI